MIIDPYRSGIDPRTLVGRLAVQISAVIEHVATTPVSIRTIHSPPGFVWRSNGEHEIIAQWPFCDTAARNDALRAAYAQMLDTYQVCRCSACHDATRKQHLNWIALTPEQRQERTARIIENLPKYMTPDERRRISKLGLEAHGARRAPNGRFTAIKRRKPAA